MTGRRGWAENIVWLQRERLVLRRGFVAESAGEKAGDGINDEGGGKFAAAEDKIANGDFVGGEMFCDAFVHAFVAATN